MATHRGNGLLAVVGLLAALFGGVITAGFAFLFESMSREATELSSRRAEAYLNYITSRARWEDSISILRKTFELTKEKNVTIESESALDDVCRRLIEPSNVLLTWTTDTKLQITADAKLQIRSMCEDERAMIGEYYSARDTIAIYGSDQVIKHIADNRRDVYRRIEMTSDANSKKARDSYVEMILQMRQESINQDSSTAKPKASFNDVLVVLCDTSTRCLGYTNSSHLEDHQ